MFNTSRQKRNISDKGIGKRMPQRKKIKVAKLPETLFECVIEADIVIEDIMKAFLNVYVEDRMQGVFDVKIFILQSAGCVRKYTRDMGEDDEAILAYFEDCDRKTSAWPALFDKRRNKKFLFRFCEFFEKLIQTCEIRKMLYDRFLLKKLILFYGLLVKSGNVSFRHAATLSALTTMTTLISIIASKSEQIRKHNSQLNTEMQKPDEQKEMFRVQQLETSIQILNKNVTAIKFNLHCLRTNVFEKAINDRIKNIRDICFKEIREWLHICPKLVFQDKYLKYLLTPFANKAEVVSVRTTCFSLLKSVFGGDYGLLGVQFATDIKNVLLPLAFSCEAKLSSDAFCLLTKISKFDVLEDVEIEKVYKCVYLTHPYRAIGRSAGEFIVGMLSRKANEDMSYENEPPTSFKMRFLYHLVDFHIRNGIPGNVALLVDSVHRWTPILKDWKALKTFLEEQISDKEKTAFIEILASCIRIVRLGDILSEQSVINVAETYIGEVSKEKRKKYSEVFCDDLPQLIRCFRDDPSKICNILLITQCVSLDTYVELRKEINLIELLQEINDVMNVSSNMKVLDECARTLKALCTEGHSTYGLCMLKCQLAGDNFKKQCIKAFEDFYNMESGSKLEQGDLLLSLKRVAAFSSYFNMYDGTLFNCMIQYMNDYLTNEDKNFSDECAKYSFTSCLKVLTAAIRDIFDLKKCDNLQMNTLRSMLCDFMNFGHALQVIKGENVRWEAFQGICQALIVFSSNVIDTFEFQDLQSLVYMPPTLLVHELTKFVRDWIFSEFVYNDDMYVTKEEAARRRRCLYAFCRLHVNSTIFDLNVWVEICRHYIKFTDIFKDIIDGMIGIIKKQDKKQFCFIIHKCLECEFVKLRSISSTQEKAEESDALQRLAKHFSSVLEAKGRDPELQKGIIFLHEEGIKFSMVPSDRATILNVPPPNLNYLIILMEFVKLLTPKGHTHLYRYLRDCEPFEDTSVWKPFVKYRKVLEKGMPSVRRTRSGRRRVRFEL